MDKKTVNFSYQAPYYKVGLTTDQTQEIWLIFHGYAQLAEEFIHSFSQLNKAENVLIFPQGLSKFYLKGVGNKIGANWMTSHERQIDIRNYLAYLDELFEHEVKPHLHELTLNILGFSQGGHTASRWINHSKIRYNKLILWGSGLAHEINKHDVQQAFSMGKNLLVIVDRDRFIPASKLEKAKRKYSAIGFEYELLEYHGDHDIYPDILASLC